MFPELRDGEVWATTRAMASTVSVRAAAGPDPAGVGDAVRAALRVFTAVEAACTRFDPASPLMQINAAPGRWHPAPPLLFSALVEAEAAYRRTAGRFDPRVLRDLVALGYDRSWPAAGEPPLDAAAPVARPARQQWRPDFRPETSEVRVGPDPVDLGGIGKGLAVRWASDRLRGRAPDHVISAGGDCVCAGSAPDGGPWRIAVEDPGGGATPVAVLQLGDLACATSSTRVRRWRAGATEVHHLLDPRTGLPGGGGLAAVTVVAHDPADAEVWSKVLFLAGRDGIAERSRAERLAALWIDADGTLDYTPGMTGYLCWQAA